MTEHIKRVNNPLTVIAIFAALAEINATVAIGLIDPALHYIFIWFVIGFPVLLVLLFFITLNFNTKVMYSPSDFKDDRTFVESLYGGGVGSAKEEALNIQITSRLTSLESQIQDSIEKKLGSLKLEGPDVKAELAKAKAELIASTDANIKEFISEFKIDLELKEKLIELKNYPAFFVLLKSIMDSKTNSTESLARYSLSKYVPPGWEQEGIGDLLENDLLVGSFDKFSINPLYQSDLEKWFEYNNRVIEEIRAFFKEREQLNESEHESNKAAARLTRKLTI